MKTRILAGLALVPLLLLVALGGLPLYIGEFVIVAIAIHEFYKAFETKKINPIFSLGYVFALFLLIKYLCSFYLYVLLYLCFSAKKILWI